MPLLQQNTKEEVKLIILPSYNRILRKSKNSKFYSPSPSYNKTLRSRN
jgi:hypothetical protein